MKFIDWILCLAIAVAVMFFLSPWLLDADSVIVSPTELGTDFVTKQWPNAVYLVRARRKWSEIPLWRTSTLGGVPVIGNPSMLLMYPLYWLIFLFPIEWSFTVYFAFHLIWVGWGIYGFSRRVLGVSPGGGLLSALVFALSAKMVAHVGGGHVDVIAAVAWLPWLWRAVDRLAQWPSWRSILSGAVAITAQSLTHLPTLWLSILVVGSWVLFVRLVDRVLRISWYWLRAGLAVLGTLALVLGLSAFQICPMLELLPFTTRGTMTLSESNLYALPIPLLIGLIFPTSLAFPEWVTYVGVVTLALAPVSWIARYSTKAQYFLFTLIILGTIFSLGCATPLYPLLFQIIPGMSWLRVPSRMMFPVQLAWALLVGVGWDALEKVKSRWMSRLVGWWMVLSLVLVIGMVWSHWFSNVVVVPIGIVAVMFVALIIIMSQSKIGIPSLYTSMMLGLVIVVEAWILRPYFITRESISVFTSPKPVVDFLESQAGRFRVYSTRGEISLVQAVVHGLETVDGKDPFQLEHYVEWMNAASGCDLDKYAVSVPTCASNAVDPQAYLESMPHKALLGIGNVRYLVANHDLPQWSPAVWQSGSVRVYENPAVLPRAFVVPKIVLEKDNEAALAILRERGPKVVATVASNPQKPIPIGIAYQEAEVIRQAPHRLTINANGPGWLVLSEPWAPGWRASVDGVSVEVYRTDVAFCGLPISKGSHKVVLVYAPRGWILGRWFSLSAIAVVIVIMVLCSLARKDLSLRWLMK